MKQLLSGRQIKKSGNVRFKDEKDSMLWPNERVGIFVELTKDRRELGVYYAPWGYFSKGPYAGTGMKWSKKQMAFCGLDSIGAGKAGLIYKDGYVAMIAGNYPYTKSKALDVSVRLADHCVFESPKRRQLECNLNLVV